MVRQMMVFSRQVVLLIGSIGIVMVGTTIFAASPAEVVQSIDQQFASVWKAQGLTPSKSVDDYAYLRRITLDLTGRLPAPSEIASFVADSSSIKRQDAVGRLLKSPAYAAHSAEIWDNILMGRLTREAFLDRNAFRDWLTTQFADNRPWSEIATVLVSAEGYNSHRTPKGAPSDPPDWDERFQPATNYFLRHYSSLPEFSASVSKNLLGVQIQCAQCHDHKTEKWTQEDFGQFTALFVKTWPTYFDRGLYVGTNRLDTKDRLTPPPTNEKFAQYFGSYATYSSKTPKLLGDRMLGRFENRRAAFANWMTDKENPWFAKAFVNRAWKAMTGTGFVEPVDDFRDTNPAVLPKILETLADDFAEHQFDIHRLLTIICQTSAYQRDCQAGTIAPLQHLLWSVYPVKPLPIETFYDVVIQATDASNYIETMSKGNMPILRNAFIHQFVAEIGTDENSEADDFGRTVPTALMQWNGSLINGLTRYVPGLRLVSVLKAKTPGDRIEALYLSSLSRKPTATELVAWKDFLDSRQSVARSEAPPMIVPSGAAAREMSMAVKDAKPDEDFRLLLKEAKTGADFKAIAGRMKNNADAGLYVKAFEAWAAEAPFQALANSGGASTAESQAYEDMFWSLLSCSEFLTNH